MACVRDDARLQGKRCMQRETCDVCIEVHVPLGIAEPGRQPRGRRTALHNGGQRRQTSSAAQASPRPRITAAHGYELAPNFRRGPVTELVRIGKPFPICAELDKLLKDAVAYIMDKLIHRDEGLCPTKHRYFLCHPCELGRGPRHTGTCCYLDITG